MLPLSLTTHFTGGGIGPYDTCNIYIYWFGMAQLRTSRPCRPLFLSRGMPIPSDLSDFPLANTEIAVEMARMCSQ
jgi:hypothetical protein